MQDAMIIWKSVLFSFCTFLGFLIKADGKGTKKTKLHSTCLIPWHVTKLSNPKAPAQTSRAVSLIHHTYIHHLETTAQEEGDLPKLFFNQRSHF